MTLLLAVPIALALVLAPVALYALLLWWLDWRKKRAADLIAASLLWGIVPYTLFILIAHLVLGIEFSTLTGPRLGIGSDSAILVSPLIQELFKSLFLFLLLLSPFWSGKNPLDGLIYGGLVGFGFAATDNLILYFGAISYTAHPTPDMAFTRAVLVGLNHAFFTGCTGLGLTVASTSRRTLPKIVAPTLGLCVGVLLHIARNHSLSLANGPSWSLVPSLSANWIGLAGLVIVASALSIRERIFITRYLEDEVEAGTLSRRDLLSIRSYWRRARRRLRALLHGDIERWQRLGRYYRLATELAFAKERWIKQGKNPDTGLYIEQLQRELYELRKKL